MSCYQCGKYHDPENCPYKDLAEDSIEKAPQDEGDLKTLKLLLLADLQRLERTMRRAADGSPEKAALNRAYTILHQALVLTEQKIKTEEGK